MARSVSDHVLQAMQAMQPKAAESQEKTPQEMELERKRLAISAFNAMQSAAGADSKGPDPKAQAAGAQYLMGFDRSKVIGVLDGTLDYRFDPSLPDPSRVLQALEVTGQMDAWKPIIARHSSTPVSQARGVLNTISPNVRQAAVEANANGTPDEFIRNSGLDPTLAFEVLAASAEVDKDFADAMGRISGLKWLAGGGADEVKTRFDALSDVVSRGAAIDAAEGAGGAYTEASRKLSDLQLYYAGLEPAQQKLVEPQLQLAKDMVAGMDKMRPDLSTQLGNAEKAIDLSNSRLEMAVRRGMWSQSAKDDFDSMARAAGIESPNRSDMVNTLMSNGWPSTLKRHDPRHIKFALDVMQVGGLIKPEERDQAAIQLKAGQPVNVDELGAKPSTMLAPTGPIETRVQSVLKGVTAEDAFVSAKGGNFQYAVSRFRDGLTKAADDSPEMLSSYINSIDSGAGDKNRIEQPGGASFTTDKPDPDFVEMQAVVTLARQYQGYEKPDASKAVGNTRAAVKALFPNADPAVIDEIVDDVTSKLAVKMSGTFTMEE